MSWKDRLLHPLAPFPRSLWIAFAVVLLALTVWATWMVLSL